MGEYQGSIVQKGNTSHFDKKTNSVPVLIFLRQNAFKNIGGWAATLRFGEHRKTFVGKHFDADGTDHRTALIVFLSALKALKGTNNVLLFTNSVYLANGIIDGYVGSDGKNQSLWSECFQYAQTQNLSFFCSDVFDDKDYEMQHCKGLASRQLYEAYEEGVL